MINNFLVVISILGSVVGIIAGLIKILEWGRSKRNKFTDKFPRIQEVPVDKVDQYRKSLA